MKFSRLLSAALLFLCVAACCKKNNTPEVTAVTGVTVSPTTLTLEVGASSTLTATVQPAEATNKGITWTSSNLDVCAVNQGVVKALAAGKATITVTTDDGGKTATCEVTVANQVVPVTSVSLDITTTTLEVGQSATLTATVLPADATNPAVTWSSSAPSICSVKNGVINALSEGNAVITAQAGEKTATCTVTVIPMYIEATEVTLGAATYMLMNVGEVRQLIAKLRPENASLKSIRWFSDDEGIATVDEDGYVTAISAGSTYINVYAAANPEAKDRCLVDVMKPYITVTSVVLTPAPQDGKYTLNVGDSIEISASVLPENATYQGVAFILEDNPSVATLEVLSNGTTARIQAKGKGSVGLTVQSQEAAKIDVTIEVN